MIRFKKIIFITGTLLAAVVLLNSFTLLRSYFGITPSDIVLKIPKGFPAPVYNFSNNKLSPEVFALGRKLFYDPLLARDNITSCASCHQNFAAFSHIDHALSHGINGKIGTRNVPALQNLIWKDAFMWDGSVNNLEEQPVNPITNPVEMGETMENVLTKLNGSEQYRVLFTKAYNDTLINAQRMMKALTQFVGLMITADSKYDHYIAGTEQFTPAEKSGLVLFRSKCANCHREPLFTDNSYRDNGIGADISLNDPGREKITGLAEDMYKFKVPGLRNIEATFPYMHDGRYKRLSEVIDHYCSPEKYSSTADKSLFKIGRLNDHEKKDLISFLLTLTDKNFLSDKRFAYPTD